MPQRTIGPFLSHSENYMLMLCFAFIDPYERDAQHSTLCIDASVTDPLSVPTYQGACWYRILRSIIPP